MKQIVTGWICLLGMLGGAASAEWSRNTFPGQGHVDNGFAPGAGWSHMENTMDISVSPLDPNFRAMIENEWGAVYTEDALNWKPLRMPHIGTPGCAAMSVEFSRYDADTMYLLIAPDFRDDLPASSSPAGVWRSTDRGATWEHLYQPPPGGYEHTGNNPGRTHMLEDPSALRTNHLYFGTTSDGLKRSTDGGTTWQDVVPELANRRIKTVVAATDTGNETVLYTIAEKTMPRHVVGEAVPLDAGYPWTWDALWQFNNNLNDDSGNNYPLAGSVGYSESCAEGSHAAVFNSGTTLNVQNLTYSGTQKALTVSTWVRTTETNDQPIVSFDVNEYWELGTRGGNALWTVRDSGGQVNEVVGAPIADGDWHHVTAVFDNGSLALYVDGELTGQGNAGMSALGSGVSVNGVVGNGFEGMLDDLRIYNRHAFTLEHAVGAYLQDEKKNPVVHGQLWRIRIDAAGDVSEAVRLHAPFEDFFDVEVNPLDASRGWVIRRGLPLVNNRYGGRDLQEFSSFGDTLSASTAVLGGSASFYEVAINPNDTNHVFLACGTKYRYGLRYSMDAGATWQGLDRKVGDHLPSIQSWLPMDHETYGLGIPHDTARAFNGAPFSFVPGVTNELVWISPVRGGMLRSLDYGATWSTYAAGGPNKDLGQIAVAHGDPSRWSVGLYEHGWSVTTNNGRTWYARSHYDDPVLANLSAQAEAAGAWWTAARVGSGVAFHPVDPDIMVATWSRQGYIVRSTDAGLSWTDTGFRNPMELWVDVFWSRQDPNRVYAGRMKSDDAGVTWSDIGKVVISVCDSDSELIVGVDDWQTDVTAASLNMHVSTNGGASWAPLPDPPRETVPGTADQWLVTGTGRKWNTMADALVAIDPGSEDLRILLAGRSGIYEYTDVSNAWTLRNTGLENNIHSNLIEPVPWMGFVVFDPRPGFEHIVYAASQNDDRTQGDWAGPDNPNRAYPGGENAEPFYRSLNGGLTWEKLHGVDYPDAPGAAQIESMTVDTLGRLFAGTTEGIYIFYDAETSLGGEIIEFVSDEGYVSGELVGQSTWAGDAGTYSVDTNLPGRVSVGAAAWQKASIGPGLPGSTGTVYTLGTAFRFTESASASAPQNAFRIEFGGPRREAASLSFKRLTSGHYQLTFYEETGDGSGSKGMALPPVDVGTTNGAGSTSDPVYIELSLTKGATESNWVAACTIYNLMQDPDRWWPPLDSFEVGFTSSIDFYDSDLLPKLNSAAQAAAAVSNVVVESIYLDYAATPYLEWAVEYDLSGADVEMNADPDGDGLNNLGEYGRGGDPMDPQDQGHSPSLTPGFFGSYVLFTHMERSDPDSGISYTVETTTNLVDGGWSADGFIAAGSGPLNAEFNVYSNALFMGAAPERFIRLNIHED